MSGTVDVAVNIFAKPYQTALAVLSLLKFSGSHIGRLYLQFEPMGSHHDKVPPYAVAEYLAESGADLVVRQPAQWLACDPTNPARLGDPAYRLSIRYQPAFEVTDKKYLFIMHNDVLITRDIIGALLERAGRAFVVGSLGQCWNCPAHYPEIMQACGYGFTCGPERYLEFRPGADELRRLYQAARGLGLPVRPYPIELNPAYATASGGGGWPLPECRVNEWGCLVDVEQTRPRVAPLGDILPFGSFETCGALVLDTAVAWFRGLSRQGLMARHLDIKPYQRHWGGNFRMNTTSHEAAEAEAHIILDKSFKPFVDWCRKRKNGMF
jgi:hypothetical protein